MTDIQGITFDQIFICKWPNVFEDFIKSQKDDINYKRLLNIDLILHVKDILLNITTSCSVVMDRDIYFAWDKCDRTLSDTQTQLSDYISLYVINKKIDWVNCSVQNVMRNSAEQLNDMLQKDKLFTAGMVDTKDVEKEFLKLPYLKFKDWNFVAVEDNPENPVKISIPALKFDCEYQIINDRIISQQGMFIANNTLDKPLVELMNNWCKEKYFVCYNIHKKLLDYIKQKYFDTNDINEERMYCTKDEESNYLEEAIRELNRIVKEKLSN